MKPFAVTFPCIDCLTVKEKLWQKWHEVLLTGVTGFYGMAKELSKFPISAVKASSLIIGLSLLFSPQRLRLSSAPTEEPLHLNQLFPRVEIQPKLWVTQRLSYLTQKDYFLKLELVYKKYQIFSKINRKIFILQWYGQDKAETLLSLIVEGAEAFPNKQTYKQIDDGWCS